MAKNECFVCGSKLLPYKGDNPFKTGTGYCEKCGTRRILDLDKHTEAVEDEVADAESVAVAERGQVPPADNRGQATQEQAKAGVDDTVKKGDSPDKKAR